MWVENFQLLKEKVLNEANDMILDIQHIGSTAIPAMWAKDVVDVQCAIQTFDDMEHVKRIFLLLGFEYLDHIKQDHVPFHDQDYFDDNWEKRFFKGEYNKQKFNIHIRKLNSKNWQFALRFKDYLTENKDAFISYLQLKQRLAEANVDIKNYCLIKDSAIDMLALNFVHLDIK